MAKIYFDPVVIVTFQRLYGVTAFMEAIDTAIPTLEASENDYLERLAQQEGWDFEDYAVEKVELDTKFRSWVPMCATYSIVILLHSLVENQLLALAERLGKKAGAKMRVKQVAGRGVEQAALYLENVVAFPIKSDPVWSLLHDLQLLRNAIVHRGGYRVDSPEHQKPIDDLIRRCPQKLELRGDGMHEQIWISMNLCREFAQRIEDFFERTFKAAGLPNRHLQMDS
jgi:hypothetical protein